MVEFPAKILKSGDISSGTNSQGFLSYIFFQFPDKAIKSGRQIQKPDR